MWTSLFRRRKKVEPIRKMVLSLSFSDLDFSMGTTLTDPETFDAVQHVTFSGIVTQTPQEGDARIDFHFPD